MSEDWKNVKTVRGGTSLQRLDISDVVSGGLTVQECGVNIESGGLIVVGSSTFRGNIDISGNVSLHGNLDISGSFSMNHGIITLEGSATVWEDLQVPGLSITGPAVGAPVLGTAVGNIELYMFSQTESVFLAVQLPHSWKIGSTIYPHVHGFVRESSTNANVVFGLEFSWNSSFSCQAFPAPQTYYMCATMTSNVAPLASLYIDANVGITPSAGAALSSMIICRLFRQSAASNYSGAIGLASFDVHFERDSMGSREEKVK